MTGYAAQFGFYELSRRLLSSDGNPNNLSALALMSAGGIGGFMAWVFSYPQDMVKSKIQAEEAFPTQYRKRLWDGGFWDAMFKVPEKENFRSFERAVDGVHAFRSSLPGVVSE